MKTIRYALVRSLPIMAGYIVLGLGFGVLLQSKGYGAGWALVMSGLIYAGSMQYVAIDLLAGGDDDRARAEKADALCGLGAEARHVLRRADALGERAPRSVEHLVELQAQQHGERRAERREHIGAKACRSMFAPALKADHSTKYHRQQQPQQHRGKVQFSKIV